MTVVIFICGSVVACRREPAKNPRIFLDVMTGENIPLRVVAGPVRDMKLKNVLGETRRTDRFTADVQCRTGMRSTRRRFKPRVTRIRALAIFFIIIGFFCFLRPGV